MDRIKTLFIVIAAVTVGGCSSLGDVPRGMSADDARNAIAKMTPQQKIKAISSSPMPAAQKEKEYAKIEAETGVKASDVLSGGSAGGPNTGQ